MKINIKDILFWIFLIIAMILLIWNVFGNSPSEFIALIAVILIIIMKVWSISDRQIKLEFGVKDSFINIKDDVDLIKEDMSLIKKKLKV